MNEKFAVIVPTLNAGAAWRDWLRALATQTLQPNMVLILDSESTDNTAEAARQAGYQVVPIHRHNFDHGGTRQSALFHIPQETEFLVYLTQDAILATPDALKQLMSSFADPGIAVAYGRQLPRPGAKPIEAHARLFNYPPQGHVRRYQDKATFGMRVTFCSNSFAGYRKSALLEAGGFPSPILFGEDQVTTATILRAGHKVAYAAEAAVFHSHNYDISTEFKRYFDIGVHHHRHSWLLEEYGKAEGHGADFVKSELAFLRAESPGMIPLAMVKTAAKYLGYRLGRLEKYLPASLKCQLSMNRGFWRKDNRSSTAS